MTRRNLIETIMGALVLVVAALFLVFAYSQADLGTVKGYELTATFPNLGGLDNGSDVRINGIKVGTVLSQRIDPEDFDAIIEMSIKPDIHLPEDTVAAIESEGLLGDKFVNIIPGHSAKKLQPGGAIGHTKTYRSLEEMVGDIIFLATDSGGGRPPAGSAPAPEKSKQ